MHSAAGNVCLKCASAVGKMLVIMMWLERMPFSGISDHTEDDSKQLHDQ